MAKAWAHGKVENKIFEFIKRYSLGLATELAADVFHTESATQAQLVSVRRALRSLERKGLIVRFARQRGRRAAMWEIPQKKKRASGRKGQRQKAWSELPPIFRDQHEPFEGASKLSAILGMMGSEHEGEILAAATKAEALRRKLGKTWSELLGV